MGDDGVTAGQRLGHEVVVGDLEERADGRSGS